MRADNQCESLLRLRPRAPRLARTCLVTSSTSASGRRACRQPPLQPESGSGRRRPWWYHCQGSCGQDRPERRCDPGGARSVRGARQAAARGALDLAQSDRAAAGRGVTTSLGSAGATPAVRPTPGDPAPAHRLHYCPPGAVFPFGLRGASTTRPAAISSRTATDRDVALAFAQASIAFSNAVGSLTPTNFSAPIVTGRPIFFDLGLTLVLASGMH